MASRILGMGDVLTLIERAEAAADEDEQAELEKRMRQGQFSFDDFLASYRMLRKMGPLQGVLKMIPGLGKQLGDVEIDDKQMARVEAIVLSMTPKERRSPKMIDGSRRKRIAAGSGTRVEQVNQLLAARKQMEKMMGQLGKGKMPSLPGMELPGAALRRTARRLDQRRSKRRVEGKEEGEEVDGSEAEVDARRVEEEPDLPRRCRRLALAARRQVHRDRRALQPPARPVADRARRGEDEGLALEGGAADRLGQAPAQGQEHQASSARATSSSWRSSSSTSPDAVRVEESERDGALVLRLTSRRTTSAR